MITLSTRTLLFFLVAVAGIIALINLGLGVRQYLTGTDTGLLYDFFDVNNEANVPTWFSVIVLFCSSLCAGAISLLKTQRRAPFWRFWWGASAIFLYLSVDEGARIHERWDVPEGALGATLVGAVPLEVIIVAVTALVFAAYFFHLPKQTKTLLLLAATCYVGGAVVVDKLSVPVVSMLGSGVVTGLLAITEEFLEQLGAILFLYTFLTYVKQHEPDPTLKIT